MAVDGEQRQEVTEAYLRTRELIKQGTNPFNPRLLEEIPDCLLNTTFMEYPEVPSTGASRPDMGGSSASGPTSIDPLTKEIVTELEPGSGEAKLAMIHAMLGYHKGGVQAYGGQWTVAPGPMVFPDWASKTVATTGHWNVAHTLTTCKPVGATWWSTPSRRSRATLLASDALTRW